MNSEQIAEAFLKKYSIEPSLLIKAPGRINLIGEHTDYNDGFVLPAAVDKAIYFALRPREDEVVRLYSFDLKDSFETCLNSIQKSSKDWANFLLGVIDEVKKIAPEKLKGFDLSFGGDVPLGAGMSSSAAIESGMGYALSTLFDLELDRLTLAQIAQNAEHNFAGLKCGIMDMYASLFGKEKHLIRLDCRALEHQYLPFDFDDVDIVLFNSGVKHNLADSEYNKRREECEEGVRVLNQKYPEINSLRDASKAQLETIKSEISETVYKRCFYVISETERMMAATEALENSELETFGQLMYETHSGLSENYEVSCQELDLLVEAVKGQDGVYGARMMGGGFGGCTINVISKKYTNETIKAVHQKFEDVYGRTPETYTVQITDGCEVI
ncbi:galactokinase [Jiulongibacter sp. NS-SX5]|uniref:galactokinase n=1 Tax=Jiulongibacter sp. NS-SX5 TaxID=3463854 RepID=UPI00405A47E4